MSLNVQNLSIRPIEARDSQPMADLILSVLKEFGCVGEGYASADPELLDLHGYYSKTAVPGTVDRRYFLIENRLDGVIYGGAGFSPLKGLPPASKTCELQKVYFRPEARGMGLGRKIVEVCMDDAARLGYQTIYLESVGAMANAIQLYEKMGFRRLAERLGNTGHSNCPVFMSRALGQPVGVC